ncbi:hypothetical protein [Frankia sp. QA3]|uniref:hypothetical protein n=1 Tax=Frankia sp. QA3 TaxID=710111 RepID=UPI000269C1A7|nr:hypothetical protein [Frankia sp. QA3]EIV92984.1 hypothetical protein FraQA3DRAFT_2658 [Frankia sp. QA3]
MPTAWWTADGADWQQVRVPLPAGTSTGAVTGLVSDRGRLVAVGRATTTGTDATDTHATGTHATGTHATDIAVAWTSAEGRNWRLASVDRATAAAMQDVTMHAGRLLAVGRDDGADSEGDGAVWTSEDGGSWRRVAVTGVDGLGTQALDRVVDLAGSGLLAVGQEPQGGGTIARVRRSTDGTSWSDVDTDLTADAEVSGFTRGPDGRPVAVGAVPASGGSQPRIWLVDAAGGRWTAEDAITGTPGSGGTGGDAGGPPGAGDARGVDLVGVSASGAALTAVGSVPGAPGPLPAAWTIRPGQAR